VYVCRSPPPPSTKSSSAAPQKGHATWLATLGRRRFFFIYGEPMTSARHVTGQAPAPHAWLHESQSLTVPPVS
jgi:hypothetical protein